MHELDKIIEQLYEINAYISLYYIGLKNHYHLIDADMEMINGKLADIIRQLHEIEELENDKSRTNN